MTNFSGAGLQSITLARYIYIYIFLSKRFSPKVEKYITEASWQESSEKAKRVNILSFVISIKQTERDNINNFCLACFIATF